MIASVTVIRQRSRRCRRRRRRRRCSWRTALALSPAAESLLALRPALLPIREARCAVVWARSCRRRWRRRRWHSRAADVVVGATPNLLAHVPTRGGTDSAIGL